MPVAAVAAMAMLNVVPLVDVVGEKVAVAPAGRPLTEKLTLPVNPLSAVTLMASVAVWPWTALKLLVLELSVKGAGPVTTRDRLAVTDVVPDVPLIDSV